MPTPKKPSRRVIRLLSLFALLAAGFRASTEPASPPASQLARGAVQRGADRLLSLQLPDGLWPVELTGSGDVASSGRSGRALLAAWEVTGDRRHLEGARRTLDALVPHLARGERGATLGNIAFVAEMARASHDRRLADLAHDAWQGRLAPEDRTDPVLAARRLMTRPNLTSWLDGSWRNYLLGWAGDEAEVARLVGEGRWAERYATAAAASWAPKHDYEFWASGAAAMALALAGGESADAARLQDLEVRLLRQDELALGLPWNDTPYDSYVHASQTASVLRGLVASPHGEARRAASEASALIVRRQAPHGGWGEILELYDQLAAEGSEDSLPADLAADETPELDALVVLALADTVRATQRPLLDES